MSQGGLGILFARLKEQFDFVIVDSSPILPIADALIVAQQVDAVLFSILADVSRKAKILTAYQRIAALGVKVLGAVVTGAHDRSTYGNKYYSGYVGNVPGAVPLRLIQRTPRQRPKPYHEERYLYHRCIGFDCRVRACPRSLDQSMENGPGTRRAGCRLESVPTVLGDWTATSHAIPPKEMAMAGAVGQILRVYTNPRRDSGAVLLLCGLPGNISTHTPDACYPGAGYTLGKAESFVHRYGVPERTAEFQTAVASREGTKPSLLRLYWTWHGSTGWSAPESTLGFRCRADALEALLREGHGRSCG